MWRIIMLCMIVGLAVAEKTTFENYKVYQITPFTEDELNILRSWEVFTEMFFWKEPTIVGKEVYLVCSNKLKTEFSYDGMFRGLPQQRWHEFIDNVQEVIDESEWRSFDFTNYHTLDEIYNRLNVLAIIYDEVQIIKGGTSYEGRSIKGVKVSFKENNPGVFIEGGIHSHEWMSPATVMYILYQVLTSNDTEVRVMAERHDWYIFPVFNPDGYVYAHTRNRFWKKTRKPHNRCTGADLNRNWPYRWLSKGGSINSCSENYAGSASLSEPEAMSMSEYIKSISDKFYAYISFRGYTQLITFPINGTNFVNSDLYAIGVYAAAAVERRYGTKYKLEDQDIGNTIDYIKNTYPKNLAFNYGFRENNYFSFLPHPNEIIPTGEEIVDSLVTLFKAAKQHGYPKEEKI